MGILFQKAGDQAKENPSPNGCFLIAIRVCLARLGQTLKEDNSCHT